MRQRGACQETPDRHVRVVRDLVYGVTPEPAVLFTVVWRKKSGAQRPAHMQVLWRKVQGHITETAILRPPVPVAFAVCRQKKVSRHTTAEGKLLRHEF
jgi:hypothetical protein